MKKVIAAALLCAVSSFATWDYFPVKDAGKGEVKVGVGYFMQDKESLIGMEAGARFSVIQGLEIALYDLFPLSESYDGNSCEEDEDLGIKCPPTFAQPEIGLRYWFPMGLGIALDVSLPFQGDALGGSDAASFGFRPAVQYSTNLTSALSLGSEVGLDIGLEDSNKYAPGMNLGLGLEFDYSLGVATPFIGVDVGLGLTKPKVDGEEVDGLDADKAAIDLHIGSTFAITEMFGADASVTLGFGEGNTKLANGEDKMPITIAAHVSLNF